MFAFTLSADGNRKTNTNPASQFEHRNIVMGFAKTVKNSVQKFTGMNTRTSTEELALGKLFLSRSAVLNRLRLKILSNQRLVVCCGDFPETKNALKVSEFVDYLIWEVV